MTRDTSLARCLQSVVVEAAVMRMEGLGQHHLSDRSAELRRQVSGRGRRLQNAAVEEEEDSQHAQLLQAGAKVMRSSHGRRRQTGPQILPLVFMAHDQRRPGDRQAVTTRYSAQSRTFSWFTCSCFCSSYNCARTAAWHCA